MRQASGPLLSTTVGPLEDQFSSAAQPAIRRRYRKVGARVFLSSLDHLSTPPTSDTLGRLTPIECEVIMIPTATQTA
jgi:hypothetical protein